MKKKIKDLTIKELLSKKCGYKGNDLCNSCPFRIHTQYGCSLHDLQEHMSSNKLESEVEVDD